MRLSLMISNNSWRVQAKCSQRLLLTFLPAALTSALKRSVTRGMQPPQPVPALVQRLTSSTEQRFLRRMASQICALLTLLQEQTWGVVGDGGDGVGGAAAALAEQHLAGSHGQRLGTLG